MRYRFTFLAGLAVGFIVGARAGRERYEQMKKLARKAADSPAMQQAAGAAQAQAAGLAKSAKDKAMERVPRLTEKAKSTVAPLGEHVPGFRARAANGQSQGETYTNAPGTPGTGSYPPGWPPQGGQEGLHKRPAGRRKPARRAVWRPERAGPQASDQGKCLPQTALLWIVLITIGNGITSP